MHNKIFVGVDIAKKKFDVAFSLVSQGFVYDYTPAGIKLFLKELQKAKPQLLRIDLLP